MTNILEAIEIPKRILTFTGHWPKISPSIFQRMLHSLDVLFILSLLVEITNHLNDFQGLSEHLALAISPISYLVKLIIFKFKLDTIQELLNVLKLKEFNDYPKRLSSVFEQMVKFSKYLGISYFLICLITVLLFSLLPILTQRDLPIMFSYDMGEFKPAIYAIQVMGLISASSNNSCLDILAMSLMGICAAQIEILNRKIIGLSDWNENEGHILHNVNAKLCKCVKHHVEIIRYHALLEKVFSMIFLTQYATSAIVICNIGFQLVHVQPASFQFLNMILYFAAMMNQLAMYCWFGNEIILKDAAQIYRIQDFDESIQKIMACFRNQGYQLGLGNAAHMYSEQHNLKYVTTRWYSYHNSSAIKDACYDFKWFESDIKTRKTLITIMERSKRPLFLTAGKLSILSLQSYTSVMRTSYSYFTLMQTLYGENQN